MTPTGNTVLITGGSSGIGFELARAFLDRGNSVIAAARNPERLAEAASRLPGLHTIRCDLARSEDVDDLARTMLRNYPDVNVLINNAGVQFNYELLDEAHALPKIERELQINLHAPIRLTAQLLPELITRPVAAVVNVTSGLAVVPKNNAPVYCPTKAALRSFTSVLRAQLGETPVRVFELLPPVVATKMTQGREGDMASPMEVAERFMNGFEQDEFEIRVGKARVLLALKRLAPGVARKLVNGRE